MQHQAGGYAHAKQFKRLRRVVKRQRTIFGILIREARRKMLRTADNALALNSLQPWLERAERVRTHQRHDKNKLYALHAPEVECIGKGKARKPYDGRILAAQMEQSAILQQDLKVALQGAGGGLELSRQGGGSG